jgi:hypothetical protein
VLLLGPIALSAAPTTGLHGKGRADTINATTRQPLLAAGGGVALLIGAAFTARTFHLSHRGQLSDRSTKAMALLASDKLTERLGGIYALEHLMIESQHNHETVVEVLAAFTREQTTSHSPAAKCGTPNTTTMRPTPSSDSHLRSNLDADMNPEGLA